MQKDAGLGVKDTVVHVKDAGGGVKNAENPC